MLPCRSPVFLSCIAPLRRADGDSETEGDHSSLAGIIADEAVDEARARRQADPKAAFVRIGARMGDR